MMHGIILALNGYSSELFHYDGTAFHAEYDKVIKLELLHPSEWLIVSEILGIATQYKLIHDFVESQRHIGLSSNSEKNGNAPEASTQSYISSICFGLKTILKSYSKVVAEMEWNILNDPFITFTHVRSIFEPFRGLFRLLNLLINRIRLERSSCLFVEAVKDTYDNNIHHQEILIPLVIRANILLYQQITDWVVFGTLPNPNTEFFIQFSREEPESVDTTLRARGRTREKKARGYYANYTLVPSHFSVQLVERILFIGNSVQILEKSEKTKTNLIEKQKDFLTKLKLLSTDTFRTDRLSETVEDLGLAVGKDLHRLVVTDANLLNHLSILKDFYLGGRGELFHDFLLNVSHNLTKKTLMLDLKMLPMRNVRLDIKECFHLAATRVQLQEDILQKIEVVVNADTTKSDIIDKYLSSIGLILKQEWPLHILFTSESINGYNEMFRFLLQVRRIQMQLKSVWVETRSIFRIPIPNGPAILRIHMTYFIDNFQYYLQADVLESQYAILTEAIEKSDTFDQIRIALTKFQSNIMFQSFRTNPALREGIQQMLDLCGNYCKHMNYLIQQFHDNEIPVCEGRSQAIDEFTTDFHRRVEFLYASFRRLSGDPQFGAYLGQLLLRLDYNSYFSKYSMASGIQHPSLPL